VAVDERQRGRILDYVAVEDCGTMVNPMVVEGQSLGGIAQGIGTALYERARSMRMGSRSLNLCRLSAAGRLKSLPSGSFTWRRRRLCEFGIRVWAKAARSPPAVIFNAVNDALKSWAWNGRNAADAAPLLEPSNARPSAPSPAGAA
jgi:carbon-monoxide dehydrogenase large subunit